MVWLCPPRLGDFREGAISPQDFSSVELEEGEATLKDGKPVGPFLRWHENGQKAAEGTYKDGELVSVKYWNRKGEEVETYQESEE